MNAEELAAQAAERVREIVQSAERRADEVLDEAREEATRIRERAEAEARERLDEVRRALTDLEGKIGAGAAEREPQPPPEPGPEPTPSKPSAEAEEAPPALEEQPAESGASTDELIEQLKSGGDEIKADSDAGAARLVAMKMVLDGASRDEVERHLADSYSVPNRRKLLDDVFAKASK
jgi:hypothetical protein